MDQIFQNTLILIENQESIQKTLLKILAQLTKVQYSDFGKRCINLIKDLCTSGGRTIFKCIQEVLKEYVVKYIL